MPYSYDYACKPAVFARTRMTGYEEAGVGCARCLSDHCVHTVDTPPDGRRDGSSVTDTTPATQYWLKLLICVRIKNSR